MADPKRLIPQAQVAAGDVCFQTSPQMDYADEAQFVATITPLFVNTGTLNGVAFGDLAIDTVENDQGKTLWRATATAQ